MRTTHFLVIFFDNNRIEGGGGVVKMKDGLNIACINVNGLISNDNKKHQLYQWMILKDIDILLIQEQYVLHQDENKRFNISIFDGYSVLDNNTKTAILYKSILNPILFPDVNISDEGIDATWVGVESENKILMFAFIIAQVIMETQQTLEIICII